MQEPFGMHFIAANLQMGSRGSRQAGAWPLSLSALLCAQEGRACGLLPPHLPALWLLVAFNQEDTLADQSEEGRELQAFLPCFLPTLVPD